MNFCTSAIKRGGTTRMVAGMGLALAMMFVAPAHAATLYSTGFEGPTYNLGNLNGQDGWSVDVGSAVVQSSRVRTGAQAAQIVSGGEVSRDFSLANEKVIWLDLWVQASAALEPAMPSSPRSAVLFVDAVQGVMCLHGNGTGGGTWVAAGFTPSSNTWFQVSLRLDFNTKRWDAYVNGIQRLTALGFHSNSINSLTGLTARAQATGDTYLDDVLIANTPPNPIADADNDGILDSVEGHPPVAGQTNMWLHDSDGDGLPDGVEDINKNGIVDAGETNPRNRDTDGDGIEDGVERRLGSNPLNPASPGFVGGDADGDGLPAFFDPNDNNPDVDGDGYKDGYEYAHIGLSAVTNAAVAPPLGDINADGVVTNLDALIAQALFLNLASYTAFGGVTWSDMNRDGDITNIDALIIQGFFLDITLAPPF